MRLATTASVAIIALSSAALAQVVAPAQPSNQSDVVENGAAPSGATPSTNAPSNTTAPLPDDGADNMLSNSASPPPTEPK